MLYLNIENNYKFDFAEKRLTKLVINEVLSNHRIYMDVSVNVFIVSKYRIRRINKLYRNVDKVTDVISFPYIPFKKQEKIQNKIKDKKIFNSVFDISTKALNLGDIVICYDKVISQSKKYCHSIKREYSFLLIHSMLHLLGYDHEHIKDEIVMFRKQDEILDKLKIVR